MCIKSTKMPTMVSMWENIHTNIETHSFVLPSLKLFNYIKQNFQHYIVVPIATLYMKY